MATKNANKILVVDDDSNILNFLIELLQDDISVSFASDGPKGLELAKLHKPDLILLDVMMPDMDGYEVCRRLKGDADTQHIPIVFLTGKDDEKDMVAGLELGAIDYITKPFDPELVVTKIQNFLNQITATRAGSVPEANGPVAPEGRQDRRAEGARRKDRYEKPENNGVMERRAKGPERPDRFPKPAEEPTSTSMLPFLVIALLLAGVLGGGYAWYSNSTPTNTSTAAADKPKTTAKVATPTVTAAMPSKANDLTAADIKEIVDEAKVQPPLYAKTPPKTEPSPGAPAKDANACGEIPKVPWWGNTTHSSITAYVINKNGGVWDTYIVKWERQLAKLKGVYKNEGTVVAPKLGTRLKGPVLADYISQVESRIKVTRCLAGQ